MNRKEFIWKTGAAMLALTLPVRNTYAFEKGAAGTSGTCLPTTADILGPYYRANAPFRTALLTPGDPGTPLNYRGTILDEDCNPLANATVDVWQADANASYDQTTPDFRYRGRFETSSDGQYQFESVMPGWYLNGSQYRPAHIHFRVTKPGFQELITQLYFQGDPYIAADPWAADPDAQLRIVPVNLVGGVDVAVFDITLKANATGINEVQERSPVTAYPNPAFSFVLFSTSDAAILSIETFNTGGQLVARAYHLKSKEYRLDITSLGGGIYFSRIQTATGIYVHKVLKR